MVNAIKNVVLSIFDYITHVFKVKDNRVICSNFNGRKYDGNSKFMCEEIKKYYPNIEIYCLGKKNEIIDNINYVKFPSFKAFYIFSTSRLWISNVRLPIWLKKKKSQFYIQTWHGKGPFKNVEKLAIDSLDKNYIKTAISDSKKMDLLIAPDKYNADFLRSCFWYDGEIVEYDLSYSLKIDFKNNSKEIIKKIKEKYNIKEKEKIILYAPTFRKYDYNYDLNLKNISSDYKVLIKLHPGIKNYNITGKNIINVSDYSSLDELLVASDILVSDYSSVVYDYLFYNKEVYLYAPDYEEYKKDRGFYVDYKNMPFPISYSIEELEKQIKNKEFKKYEKKIEDYITSNSFYKDNRKNIKIIIDRLSKVLKK